MKHYILLGFLLFGVYLEVQAHNMGATPITWNREISRLVYAHCASCHRPGGSSFSLMTYQDAQPRAVAIRDSVLSRSMPPWGAVKGYGEFRNDQGLTQEQIELITDWVENDMPKGNNRNVLPKEPKFSKASTFSSPVNGIIVSGDLKLTRAITLDGLLPEEVPAGLSFKVTAVLPDGSVKPLLWLYNYKASYRHPFLLRKPLELPVGTMIRGVPPKASILLIPLVTR